MRNVTNNRLNIRKYNSKTLNSHCKCVCVPFLSSCGWFVGGWVPFPPSTFLLAHTPDIHDDHLADDEEQGKIEAKKKLNPCVIACSYFLLPASTSCNRRQHLFPSLGKNSLLQPPPARTCYAAQTEKLPNTFCKECTVHLHGHLH